MFSIFDPGSEYEPLASRMGMVGEVLATASIYPLILVVVGDDDSRQSLLNEIQLKHAGSVEIREASLQLQLPQCTILFVSEGEVERYCGSVPVFYDPDSYRDAA